MQQHLKLGQSVRSPDLNETCPMSCHVMTCQELPLLEVMPKKRKRIPQAEGPRGPWVVRWKGENRSTGASGMDRSRYSLYTSLAFESFDVVEYVRLFSCVLQVVCQLWCPSV